MIMVYFCYVVMRTERACTKVHRTCKLVMMQRLRMSCTELAI